MGDSEDSNCEANTLKDCFMQYKTETLGCKTEITERKNIPKHGLLLLLLLLLLLNNRIIAFLPNEVGTAC